MFIVTEYAALSLVSVRNLLSPHHDIVEIT